MVFEEFEAVARRICGMEVEAGDNEVHFTRREEPE